MLKFMLRRKQPLKLPLPSKGAGRGVPASLAGRLLRRGVFLYSAIVACQLTAAPHSPAVGGEAPPLDLSTAENLALARAPGLHAQATQVEIAELRQSSHLGSLLPGLTVTTTHSPERQLPSGGLYSELTLSEDLPNPFLWQSAEAGFSSEAELANTQLRDKQQQVQRDVRLQYFAASYCHRKQELQRESLKLMGELKSIATKRYATGFINDSDLLRSRLQFDEQQANLIATEHSCRTETHKLTSLVGWPHTALTLTTPLSLNLDGTAWSEGALMALQATQRPQALREASLNVTIAAHSVDRAYHKAWTPSLQLSVSYPLIAQTEERRPRYTASLTWELFAGGRDYYSYRNSVLDKADRGFQYDQAEQDYEQASTSLIAELMALKGRWQLQEKAAKAWQQLAKQSKQRFMQGLVSSRDVNEDLAILLQQQEKNLEILHEISGKLINLSYELRKPDLLFQAIK